MTWPTAYATELVCSDCLHAARLRSPLTVVAAGAVYDCKCEVSASYPPLVGVAIQAPEMETHRESEALEAP